MKALRILLLLLLPCLLASCGERYDPLYSTEADGLTYVVRGSDDRARQIVVKLGDEVVWKTSIHGNRKVGNYKGVWGVEIMDLNFDGTKDIVITRAIDGDVADVDCYLWNQEKNSFRLSEELSSLSNVCARPQDKSLLAFDHSLVTHAATADLPETYVSTDRVTKYVWKDGILLPERRVSLSYDSEHKFYIYAVENYNESTATFEEPEETYLSIEEYESTDFSFFYYFK